MISRELIDLGQEVVEKAAQEVATGGRLVHLQLLASRLYEGLREELERTPGEEVGGVLASLADHCRNTLAAIRSPTLILVELRAAVAMLSGPPVEILQARPPVTRPQLRVIQGGLA